MSSRIFPTLLLLAVWIGAASPAPAQQTGLVAAYGFDEAGGASLLDASGFANHGTLGGATRTPDGRFGGALLFDGVSSLVRVPNSASLALTSGLTLEAWVYPASTVSAWRDVIYKAPSRYFLEGSSPESGGAATGGTYAGGPLYGQVVLPAGRWSHLAATFDGATLRLYIDGVAVASRAATPPIETSTGLLTIGGDEANGQYWAGRIDEVRIYGRALSENELRRDLALPVSPVADSVPPAVSVSLAPGAILTHTTTIPAAASDDRALASVEFQLDGAFLSLDALPPYLAPLDTTKLSNGTHVLVAIARDVGGNQTTSEPVSVQVRNPGFVNEVVVPGITTTTTLAFLPDGRALVGELVETIWLVQPGAAQPDPVPFLQLDASQLFGEQGLMDIAIDPDFAQNGFYYVFYTRGFPGQVNRDRVSRFTASGNGTLPGSELVLWQDDTTAGAEHHGGSLAFGLDGKLLISTGEHFDAPQAQQLDSVRGKILRIGRDGSIPTDNPFFDGTGPNKDAIWARGLRNPFRTFMDAATGRFYIADVGGNDYSTAFEEVNVGVAGANYGWPLCEGNCDSTSVTGPIFSYAHFGRDASITGGFVYRGSQFPGEYQGNYFFADYVQNRIQRLIFAPDGSVAAALPFWPPDGSLDDPVVGDPAKLLQGPDGALWYVDVGFNNAHVPNPAAIRRIRYVLGNRPPVAAASATPLEGGAPLEVSFSSDGSSDPEGAALSYAWTFGDGASSSAPNPTHTYQQPGSYVARLAVSDGASSTLSGDLAIRVGSPPEVAILSPEDGSLFRAGDAIAYSGSATDPEDGELGAARLSWTLLFHHEAHVHPGGGPFTGTPGGILQIPVSGHDFQGNTWYEILLTATDSSGLSTTRSVSVYPDKVNVGFDSVPSGLGLDIDGIRKQTPFALDDAKGFQHVIAAPDQGSGAAAWRFASWSDGGAQSHAIATPDADSAVTAVFASAADRDADGILDAADNCPDWANPDQVDADANRIGNACECGDQNGDGRVNVRDMVAISNALFEPSLVTPLCDTNADGVCSVLDIIGVRDRIFGGTAYCSRYPPP